jgi:hypothetical protein
MACTCGKCQECDWARSHPSEDAALRQTDSAEQPIRCGTFGEKAVRPQKVQFEQAERYRDIANRLMEHYVGLFPDCAWQCLGLADGWASSRMKWCGWTKCHRVNRSLTFMDNDSIINELCDFAAWIRREQGVASQTVDISGSGRSAVSERGPRAEAVPAMPRYTYLWACAWNNPYTQPPNGQPRVLLEIVTETHQCPSEITA